MYKRFTVHWTAHAHCYAHPRTRAPKSQVCASSRYVTELEYITVERSHYRSGDTNNSNVSKQRKADYNWLLLFFFLSPPLEKPYRLHCTVKICQAMNKNKHSNEVMKEKKEFFPTLPEMWWAVQWPHTLDKLIWWDHGHMDKLNPAFFFSFFLFFFFETLSSSDCTHSEESFTTRDKHAFSSQTLAQSNAT